MPTIPTAYFGPLAYSEDNVVHFERGLPGFEHEKDFLSIAREGCEPLIFLQSVANERLCFVTMPVLPLFPGYHVEAQPEDLDALGAAAGTEIRPGHEFACLVILSFRENETPTANLMAPVVIHVSAGRAAQVIQSNPEYLLQFPIGGESCS